MADITNDDLARRLSEMRNEFREDFAEIRRSQDRYVLREVHTAQMAALNDRLTGMQQDIDASQAAHQAADERQRASRRWVMSALMLPVIALVVQVLLALKGPA